MASAKTDNVPNAASDDIKEMINAVDARGMREEGGEPACAVKELPIGSTRGARCVGAPPVRLTNKDGVKVANNLGGAKCKAVAEWCGSA